MRSIRIILLAAASMMLAVVWGCASPGAATLPYVQAPTTTGALFPSSFVSPAGSDADEYAYDDFTLGVASSITEVRWRGGYAHGAAHEPVSDFWITFYASTANNSQPLTQNPHVGEACLASYTVGGNAGETSVGTFGATAMYDYSYVLPAPFAVAANTKYWIRIEALQATTADWGIASATGGDGSHYRFTVGNMMFAAVPGDTAFTLQ
jgi:hypothetical protein